MFLLVFNLFALLKESFAIAKHGKVIFVGERVWGSIQIPEKSTKMSASDTEVDKVPHSGPLSGPLNKRVGRKSARFNVPETSSSKDEGNNYVEITLDVRDDSVAVHSVKAANGGDLQDDSELTLLAKGLEKKSSMSIRNASAKIRQVGHELKRLTSFTKNKPAARFDRSKSAATHALKGLKFISSKTDGGHGWAAVEKRFNDMTASNNGVLPRSRFGECIGNV